MNSTTCEEECWAIDGHIPYLYEADIVLGKILKNGTINATMYPIFANDLSDARRLISKGRGLPQDHTVLNFYAYALCGKKSNLWGS